MQWTKLFEHQLRESYKNHPAKFGKNLASSLGGDCAIIKP